MKLRIAMISHYLPTGSKIGVGYQAHAMANWLSKSGHQVTMISRYPAPSDSLYNSIILPVSGRLSCIQFASMAGKLDFHQYDIIHAHSDDFLLPRKGCPPVIRTLHGSCLMEAMHIPGMREKCRMLFLAATETISARRATRAICISAHTRRFFPWTTDIIPPGVDPLLFYPPSSSQRESAILFVGTFRWRKRGKLLSDIYSEYIRPKHPEVELWMVCEDAPKREGVVMYQRIPTDSLAELYRRAMLFCLPSSYEGFGVPYAEALSCGVPVLATPNAGANEVLEYGKWGIIAPAKILQDKLLMLLENGSQREALGHQGTTRSSDFHWPGIIPRYEKVYDAALSDHNHTSVTHGVS